MNLYSDSQSSNSDENSDNLVKIPPSYDEFEATSAFVEYDLIEGTTVYST